MLKKIVTKKGRTMYYRDGRLISGNDLTYEERLENHIASTPQELNISHNPTPQEPKIEGITEELKDDPQFTVKSIDSLPELEEGIKEIEELLKPETIEDMGLQEQVEEAVESLEEKPLNLTGCLFCGAPKEHQRGVNYKGSMLEVPMCGGCYMEKTLGEIMQKLNQKG